MHEQLNLFGEREPLGPFDGHSEGWKREALSVVRAIAMNRSYFTTDQVWHSMSTRPKEPREMGAVMQKACSLGLIKPKDYHEISDIARCHSRPKRVWVSLIK